MNRYYCIHCHGTYEGGVHLCTPKEEVASKPVAKIKIQPREEAQAVPVKERVIVDAPLATRYGDGSFVKRMVCAFCSHAYGEERRTEHRVDVQRGVTICRDCLT